ncbi:hypothetical protein [Candidatus Thiodictyon syntrophicum]|jgi:quercetin dioxygenase-like cupin family protein|uniref:Cupin n=1 Tax=Candidatus Thiodictyon syntrophicum TaxID=1166950 RepID=A0A2K8UE71_9GAMM|nr:hypothetical protein [Candidatus Thiodictyon syntrophicum]AUB83880.1 hypothetical protein THSYN_25005 [Candidatus Thiodictyon syntrophicum]
MKRHKLEEMTKGWFIGDFVPTLHLTRDFEVGVKYYRAGDREDAHVHRIATEYTVIVTGKVRMGQQIYQSGDIVVIAPGESTDFEAITDAATTVVKLPSLQGDKYAAA